MKQLFFVFAILISSLAFGAVDTISDLQEGDLLIINQQMSVPKYDGSNQVVELSRKLNAQGEGCILLGDPDEKKSYSYDIGHEYEITKVKFETSKVKTSPSSAVSKMIAFGVEAKNRWHNPEIISFICYSFRKTSLSTVEKALNNKIEIILKH